MDAKLNYFSPQNNTVVTETGFRYMNVNPILQRSEVISADTEIALFEEFYKKNNQIRYCNGHSYRFDDAELANRYAEWLKTEDFKSKSFNLYYGGGIVD